MTSRRGKPVAVLSGDTDAPRGSPSDDSHDEGRPGCEYESS
jgi:hypothetical protein